MLLLEDEEVEAQVLGRARSCPGEEHHLRGGPELPDAAAGLLAVLGGEEDARPHLRPDGGKQAVHALAVGIDQLSHVPDAEEEGHVRKRKMEFAVAAYRIGQALERRAQNRVCHRPDPENEGPIEVLLKASSRSRQHDGGNPGCSRHLPCIIQIRAVEAEDQVASSLDPRPDQVGPQGVDAHRKGRRLLCHPDRPCDIGGVGVQGQPQIDHVRSLPFEVADLLGEAEVVKTGRIDDLGQDLHPALTADLHALDLHQRLGPRLQLLDGGSRPLSHPLFEKDAGGDGGGELNLAEEGHNAPEVDGVLRPEPDLRSELPLDGAEVGGYGTRN